MEQRLQPILDAIEVLEHQLELIHERRMARREQLRHRTEVLVADVDRTLRERCLAGAADGGLVVRFEPDAAGRVECEAYIIEGM